MTKIKKFINKDIDFSVIILLFLFTAIVLSILDKNFFSFGNFQSITFQLPGLGLLTLAMMVTMITGGINLSIVASTNFAGIIMAMMMVAWCQEGANNFGKMLIICIIGVIISGLIGVLNGVIITKFGITPIIATLSTQMLIEGISTMITKGYIVSGLPGEFKNVAAGTLLGIPFGFIIFVIVLIIIAIVLAKSGFGRKLYMYGSNPIATIFSGIPETKLIMDTYIVSGVITGVASIVLLSRFSSASIGYSQAYLLQTVLICVLGGVNPNGGSGKAITVAIAMFTLQLVSNGFTLLGINAYLSTAIWGIMLILVIMLRSKKY